VNEAPEAKLPVKLQRPRFNAVPSIDAEALSTIAEYGVGLLNVTEPDTWKLESLELAEACTV
jgi:hypothetical protein